MKEITSRDLRESLTLLFLKRQDDHEGGWEERWVEGPQLWASLWPIVNEGSDYPFYRIIIRANLQLPTKVSFLWHFSQMSKRLLVVSAPTLIQYNRFLSMRAKEEQNA